MPEPTPHVESNGTEAQQTTELPQNVRMWNARSIVSQATQAAANNYRLTVSETVAVVEGVLAEMRGNLLAFQAAQFERATTPTDGGSREVSNPDVKPSDSPKGAASGQGPEAKAS